MNAAIHILAVDDDPVTREVIRRVLIDRGYLVSLATSPHEALDMIARGMPDLVILDIMMPDLSGLDLCRQLRADPYYAALPIIFLTTKTRPSDIAAGLDAGADDFVSKSSIEVELPARIRALLRRLPGGLLDARSGYLSYGVLRLDAVRPQVTIAEQVIDLSPIEHRLLRYLMTREGRPASAERLLEDVWGYHHGTGDPRLVRVTIGRLRARIEDDPENPAILLTIRGQGYLLQA